MSIRRRARFALLLLVLTPAAGCGGPDAPPRPTAGADSAVTATDDLGRAVRLARPARRVVSLLPAGTETLLAMGAGEVLAGRTRYDTDPAVEALPSVGGGLDPSLEVLVALRPELVVAWEPARGVGIRTRLEPLGIPVFAISTRDTAAIFRNVTNLGRMVGRGAAADSLARAIRARLAAVRAARVAGPRPRVLYVIGMQPAMVAGTDNFIAELIGVAGGDPVHVPGAPPGLSPQLSLEELLRLQPDVVVLPVGESEAMTPERLRAAPGWRELRAVREGRVATVPAQLMNRPGPSIGEAAEQLQAALRTVGR